MVNFAWSYAACAASASFVRSVSVLSVSAVEAVAEAADADERLRLARVLLDLAAQRDDMVVDHAVGEPRAGSPDLVEQLFAREQPATMADKGAEQLELGGRRLDDCSAAPYFAAHGVHFDVAEAIDPVVRVCRWAAPERRANSGAQLPGAEGLRDVVVGAHIEAEDFLGFLRLGGQHDDWRAEAGLAQVAADLEAILTGQHHVQQNQIEGRLARAPRRRGAVANHLHVPPFDAQIVFEAEGDGGLVFDHEDPGHDGLPARAWPRGSRSSNVLPRPTSLETWTSP